MTMPRLTMDRDVYDFYKHVVRQTSEERVSEFNAKSVLRCLVTRIKYIASMILLLPAIVFAAVDTVTIVKAMRERHCAWSTIGKVEFLYLKTIAIAGAQWCLNILAPELMLTNTFDLRVSINNALSSFISNYVVVENMEDLCRQANIAPELLPDQGAQLRGINIQAELETICRNETPATSSFTRLYLRRVIANHYPQLVVARATAANQYAGPLVRALICSREQEIEQLLKEGASLDDFVIEVSLNNLNDVNRKALLEIIEEKFGQPFLHRLIKQCSLSVENFRALSAYVCKTKSSTTLEVLAARLEQEKPEYACLLLTHLLSQKEKMLAEKLFDRFVQAKPGTLSFWPPTQNDKTALFCLAIHAESDTILQALLPEINWNFSYEGHIPIEHAAKDGRKDIVEQLLQKGAHLFPPGNLVNGRQVITLLEEKFGSTYLQTLFDTADVKNCPFILTGIEYFITVGSVEKARALLNKLMQLSQENKVSWASPLAKIRSGELCSFAIRHQLWDIAKAVIPYLLVGCADFKSKQTLLMVAASLKWKEGVIALIEKGADLMGIDATGKHAFQYIAENFSQEELENIVEHIPLEGDNTYKFITSGYAEKDFKRTSLLLARAASLPDEQKPSWWTNKNQLTNIYVYAANQERQEDCELLLPHIDIEWIDSTDQERWTPLFWCANSGMKQQVLQLLRRGASLSYVDAKGKFIFKEIAQRCGRDFLVQVAETITKEQLTKKNSARKNCLMYMFSNNIKCGSFLNKIKEIFAPYSIPERLFTKTTPIADIRNYITSLEYRALTTVSEEKKLEAALLFTEEEQTASFLNFLLKEINPNHMRFTFSAALPKIKELPNDFQLKNSLETILTYIAPTWSEEQTVLDDPPANCSEETLSHYKRSKTDLLQKIRDKIGLLDGGALNDHYCRMLDQANQTQLKNMYGNIFINLCKNIQGAPSLKPKEKEAFDRELRNFIQSVGITFFHCSDRIVADSTRYYLRFVDNMKKTIEQEEEMAIQEILHAELLRLRRQLFNEVYFSIDTNAHDAATQRYLENYFNHELGLHYPEFSSQDAYQSYALQNKVIEIINSFYTVYTPIRIARHLHEIISQAISEQAQKGTRQNWYSKIQTFLESKHANVNMATVYDVETNSFTAAGIEMLLVDLGIVA